LTRIKITGSLEAGQEAAMESLGDRRFVDVPGSETHELPPLLVRMTPHVRRLDRVMDMAAALIDDEDLIPARPEEGLPGEAMPGVQMDWQRRRMDLAVNLVDQYLAFVQDWQWGDSILGWIVQCEGTFEIRSPLRNLLRPDVWPHAARSSFVTLLEDKAASKSVNTQGIDLEKAVGMRLTFRQPPPLKCFSNQFLFYLHSSVAGTAYQTWAGMSPNPVSALPPERFCFQVFNMCLD
jgi:hypothetical protein